VLISILENLVTTPTLHGTTINPAAPPPLAVESAQLTLLEPVTDHVFLDCFCLFNGAFRFNRRFGSLGALGGAKDWLVFWSFLFMSYALVQSKFKMFKDPYT
jgi:hypothetical protein